MVVNGGLDWNVRFMELAHHIARWSPESGRRVGAVIVGPDGTIRATGYNHFPDGVDDKIAERNSRATGEKYFWSSHAERNAVYSAAKAGIALAGCRIFVPWYPCGDCAKAIIQTGIVELIAYEPDLSDPRWGGEHAKVATMLDEAGVKVTIMPPLMPLVSGASSSPNV